MSWFNYIGLIFFVVMMIPNVIFSRQNKDAFVNKFDCKALEIFEQIGRYGSFLFLIFNIPYTYSGFWLNNGFAIYLAVGGALLAAYIAVWIVMRSKNNLTRAILLSVLPSTLFVFCGAMIISIPLLVFSVLFAATHITISVLNALK